ncbi:MAG: nucleotide disphospho-sugar-binding domain-containing protein [Gammaproteobacteria bacterium]
MAHIVCITSGLRGLLNASFELVARLQAAGHTVTCASPHDVGTVVEAQSLRYVQLPPVNFDPAPPPPRIDGPLGSLRSRVAEWSGASGRRQAGIEALNLAPFKTFISDEKPDLVLIDSELYEHIFTLHALEIRTALITPFFASWQQDGVPPLPTPLGPDASGTKSWQQYQRQRFRQTKLISLRNAFTERRHVLLAYARQCGYPVSALRQYDAHTLFVDTHLPVLLLTARELEFPHTPRPGATYVGPMVATERRDQEVSVEDQARLHQLYEERKNKQSKIIYCALTTMNLRDDDFLPRVVQAMAEHPAVQMIIGLGGRDHAVDLPLPDNVHALAYVPQLEVLAHSDLCITYGGMNTVHECLHHAVPMLLYPRYNDQPGVAARLVHHGLAMRGDVTNDSASTIAQTIDRLLLNTVMQDRVAETRGDVAHYRDERVLEVTVENLLGA